jgi:hypothetical protein
MCKARCPGGPGPPCHGAGELPCQQADTRDTAAMMAEPSHSQTESPSQLTAFWMLEALSSLKAWRPRPLRTGMDKERSLLMQS